MFFLHNKKTKDDIFLSMNSTLPINSVLQLTKSRQSQQLYIYFHMWRPDIALEPRAPNTEESSLSIIFTCRSQLTDSGKKNIKTFRWKKKKKTRKLSWLFLCWKKYKTWRKTDPVLNPGFPNLSHLKYY